MIAGVVTAVFKTQRLEGVVACSEPDIAHHDVTPGMTTHLSAKALEITSNGRLLVYLPEVARRVLRAVDTNVGSHAVVSVHPEVVGARVVAGEWDLDVEAL